MRLSDDESNKVMLATVIIGIYTFEDAIFTAKVYGCQEESGARMHVYNWAIIIEHTNKLS